MRPALFLCLLLLLSGCYVPQEGANSPTTRTELDLLAGTNVPVSQKYLTLGKVVATLLDETAAISQNDAAATHLAEFISDNESALTRLYIQIDNWEKHLSEEERMFFIMELLSQPYSTRLNSLHQGLRNRFAGQAQARKQLDQLMAVLAFKR